MLLAYADESGDSGSVQAGGSLTYVVGCVLLDSEAWPSAFNGLIDLRRRLRDRFGLPVRAEVKATYLVGGGGALRPLNLAPAERGLIYRAHLRQLDGTPGVRTFAVAVDKRKQSVTGKPLATLAWTTLCERLERTSHYEAASFMLIHDEGENDLIRKVARKARRRITAGSAFGAGSLTLAAQRFVDDPVPRRSDHSYFVQLADLVAYAAFRALIPPGSAVSRVAPQSSWSHLGRAVHIEVNKYSGGTPGIVLRK